tara:strand:- start:26677 stop:27678 length:1002 start_codon:yes stop_codon:yes gene_type:complete
MTTQKLNVLIIGCGNIAGGFDAERPVDALPFTHTSAYLQHGGFTLAGCIDPDEARRTAFCERWAISNDSACIETLPLVEGGVDVVSICSPTDFHREHLEVVLQLNPKIIFCEKPISTCFSDSLHCIQLCEAKGVLLAINYTRRWAPDIVRLHNDIVSGKWGEIRSVVAHYNKGILNNGGHVLDLLHYLLGALSLKSVGKPIWDFWEKDPTISAVLHSQTGVPIYLNTADARDYALFEIQLVTEHGVIAIESGGLVWRIRRAIDSPTFKGYRALDSGEIIEGEYCFAMTNAIKNLYDAICGDVPLASTGNSAIVTQQLCEEIRGAAMENISLDN